MTRSFLNKNITKLVIFLWVVFFCFQLPGEPENPDGITITEKSTLSNLSTYALLNNPGLKAAFNQWKVMLEMVSQVSALPNPQLTFAYFIQEVETRVGPQKNKVGFMQMFPWFGTLKLKGRVALEAANSQRQKVEQIKLSLLFRLKKSYYEYCFVFQNISILGKNIKLLEYLENVVKAKYKAGIAGYVDLLKIQIEKDKLLDLLRSAREMIAPQQSKLNALLNRDLTAPLPLPSYHQISSLSVSISQLRGLLKENNPELKSLEFDRKKANSQIKLAKKGYFPDFSLGLDYIITDKSSMTGIEDSGKDPIVAMIQLRLPLWFSKNKARVNQAKLHLNRVLNQKKDKENLLLAKLELVLYKLFDEGKKIKLYHDILLPRASQAVEVVLSAYKTGNTDILNFIDSLRTQLDLELKYEHYQSVYAQRKAELEKLVGKVLF